MKIKHLQLNTTLLKKPDNVVDLISNNQIDIACLQELVYKTKTTCPVKDKLKNNNYYLVEGIHYFHKEEKVKSCLGIVSKWPVIDWQTIYYNSPTYGPKVISEADLLGKEILKDDAYKFNVPGSRGIKHWIKPRAVLAVLLNVRGQMLRVITTHYTVTDLCTETIQMYEMSMMIKSYVENSNINIPCVLSGDFNIRPVSYSINKIAEVMTCHTKDFVDTLSKDHIAKKKDFPEGLAVDHVFSKGLKHLETQALEIDFSVHKALISEFEI